MMNRKQIQRFQKKIELDLLTGCWLWKGFITPKGYGSFHIDNQQQAHRISYEHWNGLIPKEMQIDHLCRNRSCVNPNHLEAVTSKENSRRGIRYKLLCTHCPSGHPYSGKNLRITKQGWRHCIICGLTAQKTLYYKKKKENMN